MSLLDGGSIWPSHVHLQTSVCPVDVQYLWPRTDFFFDSVFIWLHMPPPTAAVLEAVVSFSMCSGHLRGVVIVARSSADPFHCARLQFRPARIAPAVAFILGRHFSTGETDDTLTELVRAADCWFYGWPLCSRAPFARRSLVAIADKPQLLADVVARVHGEETFEALTIHVDDVEFETVWVFGMDCWISQQVAHALQIHNHEIAPRAFKSEVREGLGGLVDWIICQFFIHVKCVIVVLDVLAREDVKYRHDFYTLLVDSELVSDCDNVRHELMADVKARHFPLVRLLVDAGVALDIEAHNAVAYVVSNMDLDMLEWFKDGTCHTPTANVLSLAPDSAPEEQLLRLVDLLQPRGVSGEPLDGLLVRAARQRQLKLAERLVGLHASVEFEAAGAIQAALRNVDFKMLNILLRGSYSEHILSAALPTAMTIESRTCRRWAVEELTRKGVLKQSLRTLLQSVVAEECEIDLALVASLLEHGTPVEGLGNDTSNAVLHAARRCHVEVLTMLCDAQPATKPLSKAVTVAFAAREACGYDAALRTLRLLLARGAAGTPVHETLLTAVKVDDRLDMSSIERILYTAIDPQYYKPAALELVLSACRSAGAAIDAVWNSARLRGNPNLNTIVPCILKYGLNVNLRNGRVVCFAVQETNVDLLRCVLSSNPSVSSLTTAFKMATNIGARESAITSMQLLLESARLAEIGQSSDLFRQTLVASVGDSAGLKLLLRHKANIDFDNGAAVQYAAIYGAIEKSVTESLLDARDRELTEAEHMSQLLADSVANLPDHIQLPQLLIARGARASNATLNVAVRTSTCGLLEVLIDSENANTITELFAKARKLTMPSKRRYMVYEKLLSRGVSANEVSRALVESLTGDELDDLSLAKLLLEHGASVDYRNCAAFDRALCANSFTAVQLLSQYLLDDDAACTAFDLARSNPRLSSGWNISATSAYGVLVSILEGERPNIDIVHMLLAKGADPNQEAARCFLLAAKDSAKLIFRALSKLANLSTVLRALTGYFRTEWAILLWLNICLEEQHDSATIEEHDLLYACLRKFPAGTGLLNVLLNRGLDPAAPMKIALAKGWQPEQCTALIWALLAKEKIHNDVIITLLRRGGHKACPTHSTPRTGITAAFACALNKKRTPILKVLLILDRDGVIGSSTPASTLRYFGTDLESSVSDGEDRLPIDLPLPTACMFLGNFDAYRALDCAQTPDDGTLHVAAMMALPRFVKWLLDFHDPNAKVEDEFGEMVPLAMVCTPKRAA
ncbi:hypothetical protein BKA63DRAFT_551738 [Paraphoma chrysanthemicola]|nr:hypothetical protein BKA63DRAFT_551738 [Paraphoma chrysanthemicola]